MKEPFFFFKNPWDILISMMPFAIVITGFFLFDVVKAADMPEAQRLQIFAYIRYSFFMAALFQLFSIIMLFAGNTAHIIGAFFAIPFKLLISLIPVLCLAGAAHGILELGDNHQTVSGGTILSIILLGPLGLFLCRFYYRRCKSKLKDVINNIRMTDARLLLMILTCCLAAGFMNARREARRNKTR